MPLYIGRNENGEAEIRKYEVGKIPAKGFLSADDLLLKVERLEFTLLRASQKQQDPLPDFLKGLFR